MCQYYVKFWWDLQKKERIKKRSSSKEQLMVIFVFNVNYVRFAGFEANVRQFIKIRQNIFLNVRSSEMWCSIRVRFSVRKKRSNKANKKKSEQVCAQCSVQCARCRNSGRVTICGDIATNRNDHEKVGAVKTIESKSFLSHWFRRWSGADHLHARSCLANCRTRVPRNGDQQRSKSNATIGWWFWASSESHQ